MPRLTPATALLVLACTGSAPALAQSARSPVPSSPAMQPVAGDATGPVLLRGVVTDPDDAAIPGATVTLTPASGQPHLAQTGDDGTYIVRVPPGVYSVTITMPGFASYVRQGFRVAATASALNAKLAIEDQKTVINVITEGNTVSTDQDNNAGATVLKDKDLAAFSDDPDELSTELSALAGPAAGPNGGQIYIDGFTGGQLPPKSSIREIRINQNPFSAQYDRAGFGRVEVFTKPGTDSFHGSGQVNGTDRSFDTGNPILPPGTPQPTFSTILGFGSLTGPIKKRASFTMNGSGRSIAENTIVFAPGTYVLPNAPGEVCPPGTPGCIQSTLIQAVPFPSMRWDLSPRVDVAVSSKNTLTARYQYEHMRQDNQGVGQFDLASTGTTEGSTESTIQISDSQILSAKLINETRFEYQRSTSDNIPLTVTPTLQVQGTFTTGGAPGGSDSSHATHIELQNYTSVALQNHFLRLGGRLRTTGEQDTNRANTNGLFIYTSIGNYLAGVASQFQITHIAVPTLSARSTDVGLYAEDDWKARPNLTISYGLRFETQNFIHDQADFAPRFALAYALGKRTVVRAGAGFFYDRFDLGSQFNVVRNNGTNQQQTIVSGPRQADGTPGTLPPTCSPGNIAACMIAGSGTPNRVVIQQIAPRLRSPYQIQENVGLDEQLFKGATVSLNYQHIRGIHQLNSRVANFDGSDFGTQALYQYESEGLFNQNQLIANVNYRGYRGITLFGYYVLNFARSDTAGVSTFGTNPFNLGADYGRASFDTRNRTFVGGSIPLPHLITLSPLLAGAGGSPYNITLGTDQNGDTILNERAYLVPGGTQPRTSADTVKTIAGCGTFASFQAAGGRVAPVNYCTGPALFSMNLRVVKTFGFGESTRSSGAANAGAAPGASGGSGRQPSLGPAGAGGGGGRGGFGGGAASSGRRYNFSIGAQAQNLFNVVDRSAPTGTLVAPTFGQSTQLAGRFFTSSSVVRRIILQASFSF